MKTPLNYAILQAVVALGECDADDVMTQLTPEYGQYRAFRRATVVESLMTATQNRILEETGAELTDDGDVNIRYRATDYGAELIRRLL